MRAGLAGAIAGLVLLAAPAYGADPVIVAGGDVACAPESPDTFNSGLGTSATGPGQPGLCHAKYTSDLFAGLAPLNVLGLGDYQYDYGSVDRFNAAYDARDGSNAPIGWGRARTITKPVPGNHEYGSGRSSFPLRVDPDAAGYFGFFANELAAEGADASNPRKGYYSFDVPVGAYSDGRPFHWHLVALNSECAAGLAGEVGWQGGCDAGSAEEQWLRSDLRADPSDCTIAYWHHPLFTSGGEDPNPAMGPIWNALHDDYADLVLNGHDHDYERFPQRGPAPVGSPEPGRGLREIVVGTGGKNLLPPGTVDPIREIFQNTVYGVLGLTLHGPAAAHPNGWYQWEFVDDGHSGSDFTDSGSGDCVSPPKSSATATATATAGDVVDHLAPSIFKARLSRKRFRVGRSRTPRSAKAPTGTTIRFSLSEPATASLRFARRFHRAGRVKYRRAGTLRRKGGAGPRKVRFSGRIGTKKLKPGRYRLTITAKDRAANTSKHTVLRFTVVS